MALERSSPASGGPIQKVVEEVGGGSVLLGEEVAVDGHGDVGVGVAEAAGDGPGINASADDTHAGPGPFTAIYYLFVVLAPPLSWLAVARSTDVVDHRRSNAKAWVFAGIGLTALGATAAAMSATGLAAIYAGAGLLLWLVGAAYRLRTRSATTGPPAVRMNPTHDPTSSEH